MHDVLAFLGLLLPLTLSPGPVNITLAGLGVSSGIARAMPFYAGLTVSALLIAILVGFGLNEILLTNRSVFEAIRYAGIAYIFYLAYKFFTAARAPSNGSHSAHGTVDGLFLTALNPKFYVMVTVLFSQFPGTGRGGLAAVVTGFIAVLALSQFVWLAAGASIKPFLRSERAMRMQGIVFGSLLAGVAGYLLIST